MLLLWKAPYTAGPNYNMNDLYCYHFVKTKKWVAKTLDLALYRFSDSPSEPNNYISVYTKDFVQLYGPTFCTEILNLFHQAMQTQNFFDIPKYQFNHWLLYRKTLILSLNFLSTCHEPAVIYKILKPNVINFVFSIIFPLLAYTKYTIEKYMQDPEQFYERVIDYYDITGSARQSATNFIISLIKYRSRDFFNPIISRVLQILNTARAMTSKDLFSQSSLCRYAAFYLLDALSFKLLDTLTKPTQDFNLEAFLKEYLIPEMHQSNLNIFVKAQSCKLFGSLFGFNRLGNSGYNHIVDMPMFLEAYDLLLTCCNDNDYGVKLEARRVLPKLILSDHPSLGAFVSQRIQTILEILIKALQTTQLTEVSITALETLVEKFSTLILPFSLELCKMLINTLETEIQRYENQDSSSNAVQFELYNAHTRTTQCICSTISTIIDAFITSKNASFSLYQFYEIVKPTIKHGFSPEGSSNLMNCAQILSVITYGFDSLPPELWEHYDSIYRVFLENNDDGDDEDEDFSVFLAVLDNYVTNGKNVFLHGVSSSTGMKYLDMYFQLIKSTVEITWDFEQRVCGLCLIWFLIDTYACNLENISIYMNTIISMIQMFTKLEPIEHTPGFRDVLTRIYLTLLVANPPFTFDLILNNRIDFDIIECKALIKHNITRKIYLTAICKLLQLEAQGSLVLPPKITTERAALLDNLVKVLSTYIKNKEIENADYDYDYRFSDDNDFDENEDAGYKFRNSNSMNQNYLDENDDLTDQDDESDSYFEEGYVEILCRRKSPFNDINICATIKQTLNQSAALASHMTPQILKKITSSLTSLESLASK